jgi:uncharacterized protein YndB with AHSA1/START domain
MNDSFVSTAAITIQASPAEVWEALTDPDLIKQYLFDTEVETDWQTGSSIKYKGLWEGRPYEDKGEILEIEPEKRLVTTYWSAASGLPDSPENYSTVSYELEPEDNGTKLTISQTNNNTQEAADHSAQNWLMVLDNLKRLLES